MALKGAAWPALPLPIRKRSGEPAAQRNRPLHAAPLDELFLASWYDLQEDPPKAPAESIAGPLLAYVAAGRRIQDQFGNNLDQVFSRYSADH